MGLEMSCPLLKTVERKIDHVADGDEIVKGGLLIRAKFCARGHWRPAEDAKLKELVALFGPQNWNLIAQHLEGRSGDSHMAVQSCRFSNFFQLGIVKTF